VSYFIHYYAECSYAECRYGECSYAECRYGECHYAECRGATSLLNRLYENDKKTIFNFQFRPGVLSSRISFELAFKYLNMAIRNAL
jgi:hypothetical protein